MNYVKIVLKLLYRYCSSKKDVLMDKNICSSTFTVPLIADKIIEELIKPYCSINIYPAKSNLKRTGEHLDGVYYIKNGRTKHYFIGEDGSEKILYTLSNGWLFGETPIFLEVPTKLITETMETSEVWMLPNVAMHSLFDSSNIFRRFLMKNVCRKTLILRNDIEMLVFHPVKERILQLFCSSANPSELMDGQWMPLYTKLTHYEVSTIIGSARVTTSKLINELCAEGSIRMVNHRVQVSKETYSKYMQGI